MAKLRPLSLPGANRIRAKKDFQAVFKGGRKCVRPFFVVFALKTDPEHQSSTAFGMSVSRKVAKKAHDRNLIRRRLRESFRINQPRLEKGWLIVANARDGIRGAGFREIEEALMSALGQLRVVLPEKSVGKPENGG